MERIPFRVVKNAYDRESQKLRSIALEGFYIGEDPEIIKEKFLNNYIKIQSKIKNPYTLIIISEVIKCEHIHALQNANLYSIMDKKYKLKPTSFDFLLALDELIELNFLTLLDEEYNLWGFNIPLEFIKNPKE